MDMELTHLTFQGPVISDHDLLPLLPAELCALLEQINGFIQFAGGLHIRGACYEPAWHSLRAAWLGDDAFCRHYPAVRESDVPFAQDCLGDQFLLRNGKVIRLLAETGEVSQIGLGIYAFLTEAQADWTAFLKMQPLLQFQNEGGTLEPGELLSAVPPFCCMESGEQMSLRAVPARERLTFLADFSKQIANVPDGGHITFTITKPSSE
jgi:hypothetical protein